MSATTDVTKILDNPSAEGQQQGLLVAAVRLLTNREGGLNALAQTFEQNGLGHVISSWIGCGNNASISPDEIKAVLGSDQVADLANKAGISPDTATQLLTTTLPRLVDALTPDGKVGGAGELLSRGKEILAALASRKPDV